MPEVEKPYRVYRGGRARGKVPLRSTSAPESRRASEDGFRPPDTGAAKPRSRRRRGRWISGALVLLLLALVAWGVTSYLAFRKGVQAANARLAPEVVHALNAQDGLLLSKPTNVLLLGIDHAATAVRSGNRHSDSIMLVHTDPRLHRIAFLSIPRDLRVPIPGHGEGKINAAYQIGGPLLAIRTVRAFTGLPVNHVAILDFGSFRDLIDELGGITIDVPKPILSNPFDCPYTQARCTTWPGWRFAKGRQHVDGRRALVYSRIRENRLDPSESDVTRGERQQRVLQAVAGRLVSPSTLVRLPTVGADLMRPLATDLSAGQFLQLGWVKFRSPSGRALHCRLGGEAGFYGGQSVIVPSEENFTVIRQVLGDTAPQPPRPGSGPYGPGCVTGSRSLSR